MKSVDLSTLTMRGLLAYRTGLTYSRLEGEWYRPHEIFTADKHGWPGDWEGRTILALTLLAQATHREPAWLEELLQRVPEHLNKKGYFGTVVPKGEANEQQLAGHSWFLRGLIEYYLWKQDDRALKMIQTLINNLYLPTRGLYKIYPINDKEAHATKHWILSHLQSKTKTHAMTIDTGCAFIALDGITQAYELLRTPELKALIYEMIARYRQIDFLGMKVQTHATLSGIRGILRFYEIEHNPQHLQLARRMFDMYKAEAWTEDYGNYNWFCRPRWTELCAIVDSFIVSTWLWKHTANPQYLEDAHHIYFNALAFAHRASGGFGSSRCLGSEYVYLRATTYEVHWCCSMRGGEGWHKAHQFALMSDDRGLTLPFYHNLTATIPFADGHVTVVETTGYPFDGSVKLKVLESTTSAEREIRFFAPSWTNGKKTVVRVNGRAQAATFAKGFLVVRRVLRAGDTIELDLNIGLHTGERVCKNNTPGYHTFRHGPMLLWMDNPEVIRLARDTQFTHLGGGRYQADGIFGVLLTPINDPHVLTQPNCVRQVLFVADRSKTRA